MLGGLASNEDEEKALRELARLLREESVTLYEVQDCSLVLVLHTYLTTGDNPAARIQRFLGAMLEEGNTIKEIVKTLQLLLSSSRQMTKLHFKHTHAYAKTKVRIRIRHETGEPSRKRKRQPSAKARERETVFRALEELTLSVEEDATFASIEEFLLKNVRTQEDVYKYKNPFASLKNFVGKESTQALGRSGGASESMTALAEVMRAKREARLRERLEREKDRMKRRILQRMAFE